MKSRPLIGVGVIVVKKGHLLLLKRRSVHGAGTWSTPGGHLEFGESPEACAIREVEEETGVVIGNVSFMGITNDIFAEAARHYITLWMLGQYRSGTPSVQAPYEMSAVDWFHRDNLPQPLFRSLQHLVDGNSHPQGAWEDAVGNL